MARLSIDEVLELGVETGYNAVTWEVARVVEDEKDFSNLVGTSIKDKVNLTEWKTPLLYDGVYYDGSFPVKARARLHYGDKDSPWYVFKNICEVKMIKDEHD